jgi:hypothetical protein
LQPSVLRRFDAHQRITVHQSPMTNSPRQRLQDVRHLKGKKQRTREERWTPGLKQQPEQVVINWLAKDPDCPREKASAMLRQVEGRDYKPPRRERILQWQAEQDFLIVPDPADPDCGNVYKSLKFTHQVYDHIENYQMEKAEANS